MAIWQIFIICSMIFLLIEIFVPMMFFLNFALGCLITAGLSIYTDNLAVLITFAVAISGVFLAVLRPMFLKTKKENKTGLENKYIGKVVKVVESVNKVSGAVTIYDERWNARSIGDDEFPVGSEVKIVKNDGLVFYVEKI